MLTEDEWGVFRDRFNAASHELTLHMENVEHFFAKHPQLRVGGIEKIHSTKSRLKDLGHLRAKIDRKIADGRQINEDNFLNQITDLVGVRLLLLFQADFGAVDGLIRSKVNSGDWFLGEKPKAYTWDPESARFFENYDLEVVTNERSYTSVHYLIKPREDSFLCCELQVRTLFEEIWGEVDHRINYPTPTEILACKEQILVLSKIVGAGSRLVDSIQRSMDGAQ
jgi:ppGpp synthetase/RelA/SpoT-type nucleotidyltranferase